MGNTISRGRLMPWPKAAQVAECVIGDKKKGPGEEHWDLEGSWSHLSASHAYGICQEVMEKVDMASRACRCHSRFHAGLGTVTAVVEHTAKSSRNVIITFSTLTDLDKIQITMYGKHTCIALLCWVRVRLRTHSLLIYDAY